jgi:hypothetical protein
VRPDPATLALGALFGFVSFAAGPGVGLANPTSYAWVLQGDWNTHFLGWHLFRHAPWTLPLGATPALAWPIGSSVGLTDSLPAAAFLFKLVDPLLPATFQYIGLWLLLCFILQGVMGARLMQLTTDRPAVQRLGAALFVMSPTFLVRIAHPALDAHWLLLAALILYFTDGSRAPTLAGLAKWLNVTGVAAATHPYKTMKIATLAVATYGRQALARRSDIPVVAAHLLALTATAAFFLWQSGYFVVAARADLEAAGFGVHSMNLLSFVMPTEGPTRFSPGAIRYASVGQDEGYAYLGAGMLLLGGVALVAGVVALGRRGIPRGASQHLPLALALLFLTALALSPVVTLGARTLFTYDPTWWGPLRTFRASGRMIWPVYYVVVIAILGAVGRLPSHWPFVLLTLAASVQALDLAPRYEAMRQLRHATVHDPLQSPLWRAAPRHYRHLTLAPTNLCDPSANVDHTAFSLLAGHERLTINAGSAARVASSATASYCQQFTRELDEGHVDPATMYVLRADIADRFRSAAITPVICPRIDQYVVCVAAATYAQWQDAFDVMTTVFPDRAELATFYSTLDTEYAERLQRRARPIAAPPDKRMAAIGRYLWYRAGGCSDAEAAQRTLREVEGLSELHLCGDGLRPRFVTPAAELGAFWQRVDEMLAARRSPDAASTHVDPEGEAVWTARYIEERLNGRDALGARVNVLNAIRSAASR